MPLFRFHRGSLEDSLATTQRVKTKDELLAIINKDLQPWHVKAQGIKIAPYPSKDNCFDNRIGWFTHIVKAEGIGTAEGCVYGFLSEDLD